MIKNKFEFSIRLHQNHLIRSHLAAECHPQIRKNVERCAGLRADKVILDMIRLCRVTQKLTSRVQGIRVNDDLRDKKEFRNPGILELLMDKYNIRETG